MSVRLFRREMLKRDAMLKSADFQVKCREEVVYSTELSKQIISLLVTAIVSSNAYGT